LQKIIDTPVNIHIKRIRACVCIIGRDFEQVYCKQLKVDNW